MRNDTGEAKLVLLTEEKLERNSTKQKKENKLVENIAKTILKNDKQKMLLIMLLKSANCPDLILCNVIITCKILIVKNKQSNIITIKVMLLSIGLMLFLFVFRVIVIPLINHGLYGADVPLSRFVSVWRFDRPAPKVVSFWYDLFPMHT